MSNSNPTIRQKTSFWSFIFTTRVPWYASLLYIELQHPCHQMSLDACACNFSWNSAHFLHSQQCYQPNLSIPLKSLFMLMTESAHEMGLIDQEKNYLPSVKYPHHICQTILMTQDVSFLPSDHLHQSISLIVFWSYMPFWWCSHCHSLAYDMACNGIILLLQCWLYFWDVMDNWHVISIKVWGSRYRDAHCPQLMLDGT